VKLDASSTAARIFGGLGIQATLHCAPVSLIFRLRGWLQIAVLIKLTQETANLFGEATATPGPPTEQILYEDDLFCAAVALRVHRYARDGFEGACNCT
jgi:hypothetical protein